VRQAPVFPDDDRPTDRRRDGPEAGAGERREDLWFSCFAAMEGWRDARGSFVASELLCQFVAGWIDGTSTWFDTEGGGR
jgi:hypothetical protein